MKASAPAKPQNIGQNLSKVAEKVNDSIQQKFAQIRHLLAILEHSRNSFGHSKEMHPLRKA